MAAKTTDFFGSDARLHVKELDGNSMVKLLNELVELFGISLMTTNEGWFNTPRIRPFSPALPLTGNIILTFNNKLL